MGDREVADPDRPLEGTRWVVDGIVAGDAVLSIPAGVTAALTRKACAPEAMAVEQAVTAVLSGQVATRSRRTSLRSRRAAPG